MGEEGRLQHHIRCRGRLQQLGKHTPATLEHEPRFVKHVDERGREPSTPQHPKAAAQPGDNRLLVTREDGRAMQVTALFQRRTQRRAVLPCRQHSVGPQLQHVKAFRAGQLAPEVQHQQ
eukprot:288715-Prymnesium_polylepis.1